MIAGVGGGVAIATHRPLLGAALIFASAILDSVDGQIARMRKASSHLGRMLDGCADGVGGFAGMTGATVILVERYGTSPLRAAAVVLACLLTGFTSSRQHAWFDHYKNVWLAVTSRGGAAPDDEQAARRRREAAGSPSIVERIAWTFYIAYLRGQAKSVERFDPWTPRGALPSYDPARAARYRHEHRRAMRIWCALYGFGTMLIGLSIFAAVDRLDLYVLLRLVVLNGILFGYLRREQRRASRATFGDEAREAT
jgi:hypothetical protein